MGKMSGTVLLWFACFLLFYVSRSAFDSVATVSYYFYICWFCAFFFQLQIDFFCCYYILLNFHHFNCTQFLYHFWKHWFYHMFSMCLMYMFVCVFVYGCVWLSMFLFWISFSSSNMQSHICHFLCSLAKFLIEIIHLNDGHFRWSGYFLYNGTAEFTSLLSSSPLTSTTVSTLRSICFFFRNKQFFGF